MPRKFRPRVSDHAVLRYLERVEGIDVERVRRLMLSETIATALEMGATRIRINGVFFAAENGMIKTLWKE